MAILTDEELSDMKNKVDKVWTQFVELEKRIKTCEDRAYADAPAGAPKASLPPIIPGPTPPAPGSA